MSASVTNARAKIRPEIATLSESGLISAAIQIITKVAGLEKKVS